MSMHLKPVVKQASSQSRFATECAATEVGDGKGSRQGSLSHHHLFKGCRHRATLLFFFLTYKLCLPEHRKERGPGAIERGHALILKRVLSVSPCRVSFFLSSN